MLLDRGWRNRVSKLNGILLHSIFSAFALSRRRYLWASIYHVNCWMGIRKFEWNSAVGNRVLPPLLSISQLSSTGCNGFLCRIHRIGFFCLLIFNFSRTSFTFASKYADCSSSFNNFASALTLFDASSFSNIGGNSAASRFLTSFGTAVL